MNLRLSSIGFYFCQLIKDFGLNLSFSGEIINAAVFDEEFGVCSTQ